ncbi:MAG: hypothetical protein QNK23_12045 [Crocinitomicaceae bacterium]|nr:hypothetical protein [Crocinitomicaceae bacterium]
MDNPVDNIFDFGLVNYTKHPTNKDYIVYRFGDKARADSFEEELIEAGIEFEKDHLKKKTTTFYLIATHKNDYKKTSKINFDVEAKHKKPFLPFAAFRYFLILFSAAAITLASVGYCKHQEELRSLSEPDTILNTNLQVE